MGKLLGGMLNMAVRFNIKVNIFIGKPIPELQWYKNQKPIELSAALQIDIKKNDHTILCIPAAVRDDCGAYSLKVWNSKGESENSADLTVLGKPSKPRGPLEVENVTEEGCDLTWKPPVNKIGNGL